MVVRTQVKFFVYVANGLCIQLAASGGTVALPRISEPNRKAAERPRRRDRHRADPTPAALFADEGPHRPLGDAPFGSAGSDPVAPLCAPAVRSVVMNRTDSTYQDALDAMETRWEAYRRALSGTDRDALDRLFEYARAHADAGRLQIHQPVEVTAFVSVFVEQQKRIDDLEDRLDHLESDLNGEKRRGAARSDEAR